MAERAGGARRGMDLQGSIGKLRPTLLDTLGGPTPPEIRGPRNPNPLERFLAGAELDSPKYNAAWDQLALLAAQVDPNRERGLDREKEVVNTIEKRRGSKASGAAYITGTVSFREQVVSIYRQSVNRQGMTLHEIRTAASALMNSDWDKAPINIAAESSQQSEHYEKGPREENP